MKVGFIGAGRMTQRRLVNLPDGCEAVAVYAHDEITDRYTGAPIDALLVPSSEKVIEMSDLVVVATPHAHLARYAHLSQAAGCQVFIEKPGGVASVELEDLSPCRVGYNHRFWPGIQEAKAAITAPVLHLRAAYGHGHAAPGDWRMGSAGGGEMLDQGSHLVDLCRYLTGDEVRLERALLSSRGLHAPVEDTALVMLSVGPAIAQLSVSWCEWSPMFRFEIITEEEKITVEGFPWEGQTITVSQRGSTRDFSRDFYGDCSLRLELEDMIAGGNEGATVEDALAVLRVVEAAVL